MSKKFITQIQWDLSLFVSSNNFTDNFRLMKKDLEQSSYSFIHAWKNRDDYLKDPKILKEALDEYERWARSYAYGGSLTYYFELLHTLNQTDPKINAKLNQSQELAIKIENEMQFFTLKIAKIPSDQQEKFLKDPNLDDYRHFLTRLFEQGKYLLSDEEEKILNLKSIPAHINWVKMVSTFLAKEEKDVLVESGKKETKTLPELVSLINSKNKNVRDSAAKAFNKILKKYTDVAEAELNAILQNKKIDDELRNISRPDLSRHLQDDIDSEVVDTLLETVTRRFDIAKKYYQLKAKLFKVKKLEYHERNVEYGNIDKKYTYDDAVELVLRVCTNLDPDFENIFLSFVKNGQIDVYPKKGKRGGAVCYHHTLSTPTYILLNHTDKLQDVLIFAHELGHGINNELIRSKHNALNFGTPLSTAEVASTFMEDFVLQELLKDADEQTQLALMVMKLNNDVSTIFRQVAAYQFEKELHQTFRKKGYLSKEEIGKIFQKHMHAYMGPAVEQSEGSENWWVYWSHFRTFFYVYSYASGLLISKSLQSQMKEHPQFIQKVKKFLSAGLSDSPKNIFANLGIDITDKTFWDKGLDEVEQLLDETTKLAKKLGKI